MNESLIIINKSLRKYLVEIIIVTLSLISAIISAFIFYKTNLVSHQPTVSITHTKAQNEGGEDKIYINISGSVNKPGMYLLKSNSRLNDAIIVAGNLTEAADKDFTARNYNLSEILFDQEKIYIPSKQEVKSGLFTESSIQTSSLPEVETSTVSINKSSAEELEKLPNIGKVTAEKIVQFRPYKALDELYTRGIITKTVFNKIVNSLTL